MAGKIKTRDRILATALALFNEDGESRVSTVDIAAALGISPGNLYYHFHGKEEIIEQLFADFEAELRQVLIAPADRSLSLEDHWIFIYIVFEEIHDFRFFYESPSPVIDRCPSLGPRFQRLIALKRATLDLMLANLEQDGALGFAPGERIALAERMTAHLVFWLPYRRLAGGDQAERAVIHEGVRQAVLQTGPYVVGDRARWREAIDAHFAEEMRKSSKSKPAR